MSMTLHKSEQVNRIPGSILAVGYAIEWFGSICEIKAQLNVTSATVNNWKARGVPAKYAVILERRTDGYVTKEQLRPDIFEPDTA